MDGHLVLCFTTEQWQLRSNVAGGGGGTHSSNPSTWWAKAGESLSLMQPGLYSELQDSQGYT